MRFGFWFFLTKDINLQEPNSAPPSPIFTPILHCKLLRHNQNCQFSVEFLDELSSQLMEWRLEVPALWQERLWGPCCPSLPHPNSTNFASISDWRGIFLDCVNWEPVLMFSSQTSPFLLLLLLWGSVFRPAELSQSRGFSLELVQVGAQDSCSRIYLFKNIPAAPLSLGNCKNNSIKNKPANKGEKAELCEDMKYSRLNSAGKLFPPPVPFQGWNDVLWFLNTNPDLHKFRDFICAELQIAGIVIPGYFMAHP